MSAYTCITCRVMFGSKEFEGDGGAEAVARAAILQKEHYKTDWHRYNLKRKVADLPPVTAENFNERVLAQKSQAEEKERDKSCWCDACGRHFSTVNAFTNHLQSKKHKEAADVKAATGNIGPADDKMTVDQMNAKNRAISAAKTTDRQQQDRNAAKRNKIAKTDRAMVTGSVTARSQKCVVTAGDSDVDNEWEDVDDEEEDVSDEADQDEDEWEGDVFTLKDCLFCSHVSRSLQSNIKHMTIAHSFFVPDIEYVVDLEGLVSYLGEKVGKMRMCLWCNEKSRLFTSREAVQQHMIDKGHCKIFHEGDAVLEFSDFYDYRSSYPDYKKKSRGDPATGGHGEEMEIEDDDEDVVNSELTPNVYQLVLPSGAIVGHRALVRYYKQKLKYGQQLVVCPADSSSVSKVMAHYKTLGWIGTTGAAAEKKAKDIAYVNRMKSRYSMQLGVKANKLQRHFRDDNFGCQ